MKKILLDFSEIKTLYELHDLFENVFSLPDYYGRNMDALWDCLHCSFEEETTICVKNISALPDEMKEAKDTVIELFHDLEAENSEVSIVFDNPGSFDTSDYIV